MESFHSSLIPCHEPRDVYVSLLDLISIRADRMVNFENEKIGNKEEIISKSDLYRTRLINEV